MEQDVREQELASRFTGDSAPAGLRVGAPITAVHDQTLATTGLVPRRESHPPTALAVWGIRFERPPLTLSAFEAPNVMVTAHVAI